MTQTKYPISKIRSGEVAVKLISIGQFKKIAPEQKLIKKHFEPGSYHLFSKFHKAFTWVTNDYIESFDEKTCDFHQIDWEEVKEVENPNSFSWQVEAEELRNQLTTLQSTIDQLTFQLKAADAENERLKEESEKLKSENEEVYRQLKLRESSKTSPNQELTLKQRMAWEIVLSSVIITKEDTTHIDFGVANNIVDTFLNYKGGDNE